ncbi:SLBB domain-containing protein [Laspinema olomoucense]|uniref:SLBB domain-containing protein n=1 Tax=Laspinema olomoucense D3b TaxID=2953688 RepID=A0ABT2N3Z6_9CYAN|nr:MULTISPECIES: SLBB domain-containing protein [unclassified Laspinema]MCT7975693.1 SLBB domain-containing protein [Laspinema sp. D3d]MCT7977408.1 SLBB domain-containing protein [Laspinema sp. D3b]MCT7995250.1 SLBB domain-containing protein [Laspinema sp. D3c]
MVSAESFSTPSHSHPWSSTQDLSQPIAHSISGLTFSMLIALTTALPAIAQPSVPLGQEPLLLAQGGVFQEAYTLGPGDRIQIDIFNVPEYSGENGQHQVLVDGTLNLPLVGRVSVEGLTLEQAASRLRNLYAPYLQRPEFLTISVMERRPVQVGISGEVRRPGSYIIGLNEAGSPRPTITTAIELAGGITSTANIRQVQLLRRTRGGPNQLITIDLTTLVQLGDLSQDVTIRDGDTIFIPPDPNINANDARQLAEASISGDSSQPINIAVVGEINKPGSYTVAGDAETGGLLTLTRALQTAGGVTQSAEVGQIQVRRQPKSGPAQILSVNLWQLLNGDISQDIILQQGDTIYVPTGSGFSPVESSRLAQANFAGDPTQPVNIAVVGEVSRPGSYTVTRMDETGGLLTVTRALETAGGVTQSAQLGEIQVLRQPQAGPARRIPVNLWALLREGDLSQDIILQQGDTIYVPTGTGFNATESTLLAEASFAGSPNQPVNIAVSGEVARPGSYTVTRVDESGGLLTVTRALQTAGGVTLSADIREIRVNRRPKAGSPQTIVVNLWEMLDRGDFSQDIILQQGDTIEVPTASNPNQIETVRIATANFAANTSTPLNIAIVGEVNRPGTYTVSGEDVSATGEAQNLTTASTGGAIVGLPTVTRAIKIAGGITPTADIRRIQVLRQRNNGTQQIIDVNLWELLENGNLNQDVLLQQGDTIVVQTATNIDLAEAPRVATASFSPNRIQVNMVGEIQQPGLVELPPNASLNQAILVAGGFNNTRAAKDEVELIRLNPNGTVSRQTIPIDFAQGLDEATNPILRNNDVIVVGRTGLARFGDRIGPVGQVTNSVFSLFGILRFFNLF